MLLSAFFHTGGLPLLFAFGYAVLHNGGGYSSNGMALHKLRGRRKKHAPLRTGNERTGSFSCRCVQSEGVVPRLAERACGFRKVEAVKATPVHRFSGSRCVAGVLAVG